MLQDNHYELFLGIQVALLQGQVQMLAMIGKIVLLEFVLVHIYPFHTKYVRMPIQYNFKKKVSHKHKTS